jgi:transposase-like protein
MKEWKILTSQDRFLTELVKNGMTVLQAQDELLSTKLEGIEEEFIQKIVSLDKDIIIVHKNCTFCESFEIEYDVMTSEWKCRYCHKTWQAVKLHRGF